MAQQKWNSKNDRYRMIPRAIFEPWQLFHTHPQPKLDTDSCNWMPDSNIFETETEVIVFVELPGMRREDVVVRVQDRILSVSGERPWPNGYQRYSFIEGNFGTFCRSFTLKETVDPNRIEATMENGVLRVAVPKIDAEQSMKIHVQGV